MRMSDHLEVGLEPEHGLHALADDDVVVGQEDRDRGGFHHPY
jgi:hypothetical protein